MTENAVDVSSYQGLVDWQAEAAAGVQVGICKATEGTGWTDPTFAGNWAGIKTAGMLRGAYHFAGGGSVTAEVDHFLSVVGPTGPTDKLWLDLEANAGPGWGYAFMVELERRLGGDPSRCGIYTGRWYIDATGGPVAWQALTRWGYWFSAYTAQLNVAALAPWTSCVLWQNTSSARIPGVHGVCDASIIENGGFFSAVKVPDKPKEPDMQPLFRRGETGQPHSVYWVAADGGFYTQWQKSSPQPDGSVAVREWSAPLLLAGGIPGGGIVGIDMNDQTPFETIVLCKDNRRYTTYQVTAGSDWKEWQPLP